MLRNKFYKKCEKKKTTGENFEPSFTCTKAD